MEDEGVRRASNPDDDSSLQGLSNNPRNAQREVPAMWEEILAKMSLQVGELLDIVDGVKNSETHHTRPVAHEETKRRAFFRG